MTLVLDTNILIELYRGNKKVIEIIKGLISMHPENPAITFANFSEFYLGMLGKREIERERALLFLGKFTLLNTARESSKIFSELKYALGKEGKAVPDMDILIASLVLERGMTLLTMDKHFERIEKLNSICL